MAIGDHNISNANKLDQPDCLSVEQAWINGFFLKNITHASKVSFLVPQNCGQKGSSNYAW